MATLDRPLLLKLLVLALRPAVRFCLRHSIKIQDLIECAKVAFIEGASRELGEIGHKLNVSRLSVVTGVHRRDIARFQAQGLDNTDRDLIARVMGQWRTDKRFQTKSREPKVLSFGIDDSEFHRLCESVSQDLNPGTVVFELERVEAVVHTKGGLKLVHQSYVPQGDPAAGFAILADDSEALLDSVEENVLSPDTLPQLHARTFFDNVRPESAPEIKRWFLKEGHEFHARVRAFVSQYDQDINPDPNFIGRGIKVVLGIFGNVPRISSKFEKNKKK